MPRMHLCPRCAAHSYEVLSTHAYCANCNYSPEFRFQDADYDVPKWAIDAANDFDTSEKKHEEKKVKGSTLIGFALTAGFLFILSSCGPETQELPTHDVQKIAETRNS